MTVDPLVSVLTPSFNQARWLADNLRSVASQTYPHIEHIVMDGGSTDDSVDILRHASPAVRWRSEPDRGQSHALNKALAESRGEIIGWLNSDDAYFTKDVVGRVVDFMVRHPEVDVVYGHAALINGDGLILQMIWVPPFNYRFLRHFNFIIQPAAFMRRPALGSVIADESYDYCMDRELWLRLGRDHMIRRLGRVLAVDRHHAARKSLTRMDLAAEDEARLVATYGPGIRSWSMVRVRLVKVALRLAGFGLAARAPGAALLAFDGAWDGRARLAFRQAAVKRASMPAEQGARGPRQRRTTP